jgi:hypothetical protein
MGLESTLDNPRSTTGGGEGSGLAKMKKPEKGVSNSDTRIQITEFEGPASQVYLWWRGLHGLDETPVPTSSGRGLFRLYRNGELNT